MDMVLGYESMDKELKKKVKKMSDLQKNYSYFRARGFTQVEAAKKAGSKAKGRQNLTKIGYLWEKKDGVKELIAFLKLQTAIKQIVNESEIIDMLRRNYNIAIANNNIAAANKAAELLGQTIGIFKVSGKDTATNDSDKPKTKNNTDSFKEDITEDTDKIKKARDLQAILNTTRTKK